MRMMEFPGTSATAWRGIERGDLMDFYGQYDIPVDRFLYERYFPDTNIKGFFIECGAFDGTTLSSCRFFEESMGWAGLNLEPAPEVFARLIENRRASRNLNFGLSDKTGEMTFNRVIYPQLGELSGLYGSLEPSPFLLDQVAQGLCTLEEIAVQTLDWNTLIERQRIHHVTLLVLDVEGHELSVLAGMAGSKVLPEVICVEFGHLDFLHLRRVMDQLDYVYDIHSFGNAFFIRRDVLPIYALRAAHRSAARQPALADTHSEASAREQTPQTSLQDARYAQLESENLWLRQRETELVGLINLIQNSRGWKALEAARRVRSFWKRPARTPPTGGPADPQVASAAQPQDPASESRNCRRGSIHR
jgi:FkbM family methyltransferase